MPLIEQRLELSSRELEDHADARHVCQARVDILIPIPPLDLTGLGWILLHFLFGGASLDRPPDEEEVTSSLELMSLLDQDNVENG